MRGATWRILAIALFVSGSFGFLCFPLYSSKNLKPTRVSISSSSSTSLFLSLRSFSPLADLHGSSLSRRSESIAFSSQFHRIRQISSIFSFFSTDFVDSRSNPGIC